jgi:hypothetical protein
MKKLRTYYILLAIPFSIIALARLFGWLEINSWLLGMIMYGFFYYPLLGGLRLIALGIITEDKLWLNFIPFWNYKYRWTIMFHQLSS